MPASPPLPTQFVVEAAKVSSYLLDLNHPDGKSKANFFIGWGFDPARPDELVAALLSHPAGVSPCEIIQSVWGTKFVYEGGLIAPNGPTPSIRTIWEVAQGETVARLLTAYRFRAPP